MKFPASGLYAITQTDGKSSETIIQEVYSVIKSGVSVIQYRDKNPVDALYLAKEILAVCKRHQVPLIINDDADFANSIGADGVHIGKDDGGVFLARKILGSKAIIGISCYDDINIALKAEAQGVDYVAFGRFFPSSSKPLALPAHTKTLNQAKKRINVPIVAIGGILPENGGELLDAGADVLAVIGGIFEHNPIQSTKAYMKLFN